MSAVRKPFDWVREAGMLRGELMALELFLIAGVSNELAVKQVQKALRESMARLDAHDAAMALPTVEQAVQCTRGAGACL